MDYGELLGVYGFEEIGEKYLNVWNYWNYWVYYFIWEYL